MTAKEYLQKKHEWHKKHWNEHEHIDDNWWANEMEGYHQAKLKLLDILIVSQRSEQQRHYQYQQKQTDPREDEYYAEMERAYYDEIAKKNNWLYRVLCSIAQKVNFANERLQQYKEKVFNSTMSKGY